MYKCLIYNIMLILHIWHILHILHILLIMACVIFDIFCIYDIYYRLLAAKLPGAAVWSYYEMAIAARNHCEPNVFKSAIENPKIQAHLGLGIGQSVFDQCVFAYILFVCIFSYYLTNFCWCNQVSRYSKSQFGPLQGSKSKKSDDYVETKCVLGLRYSKSLHYTYWALQQSELCSAPAYERKEGAWFAWCQQSSQVLLCVLLKIDSCLLRFINDSLQSLWGPASVLSVVLLHLEQRYWAWA